MILAISAGPNAEEPEPSGDGGFKCIRTQKNFVSRELLIKHLGTKSHMEAVVQQLKDIIGDDQVIGVLSTFTNSQLLITPSFSIGAAGRFLKETACVYSLEALSGTTSKKFHRKML